MRNATESDVVSAVMFTVTCSVGPSSSTSAVSRTGVSSSAIAAPQAQAFATPGPTSIAPSPLSTVSSQRAGMKSRMVAQSAPTLSRFTP
jgi:hypothetical protein